MLLGKKQKIGPFAYEKTTSWICGCGEESWSKPESTVKSVEDKDKMEKDGARDIITDFNLTLVANFYEFLALILICPLFGTRKYFLFPSDLRCLQHNQL